MEKESNVFIQGRTKHLLSRGILAKKLTLLGFSQTEGYEFLIDVYDDIINLNQEIVPEEKINDIISSHLASSYNKTLAEQYLKIEEWRGLRKPIWILIAGAIGTGKSTLSRRIAGELGIQHVIGTDVVRDILRKILSEEVVPELHSTSYCAFQSLKPIYSSRFDEVILGFDYHSKYVNLGVDAVLSRAEKENVSIVIEGEHLLPAFFDEMILSKPNVLYITISVPDPAFHRENLSSQYTKEKEELLANFDNIRKIHEHLVNETQIRNLPLVETIKGESTTSKVRKLVVDKIVSMISSQ